MEEKSDMMSKFLGKFLRKAPRDRPHSIHCDVTSWGTRSPLTKSVDLLSQACPNCLSLITCRWIMAFHVFQDKPFKTINKFFIMIRHAFIWIMPKFKYLIYQDMQHFIHISRNKFEKNSKVIWNCFEIFFVALETQGGVKKGEGCHVFQKCEESFDEIFLFVRIWWQKKLPHFRCHSMKPNWLQKRISFVDKFNSIVNFP